MDFGEYAENKNYMYMVRCCDGTIYTNHLERRISQHNSGRGARYTKSRRPVELVYYEEFDTKQKAMSREAEVKNLTREQKLRLIETGKCRVQTALDSPQN